MPHFPLPLPRCCRLSDGERQRCLINEKKKRKDERVTERVCESQRLIMIKQIQAVARRVKFIQLYFLQEENQLFDSTQSHRSGILFTYRPLLLSQLYLQSHPSPHLWLTTVWTTTWLYRTLNGTGATSPGRRSMRNWGTLRTVRFWCETPPQRCMETTLWLWGELPPFRFLWSGSI